ncbi:hypothetical protein F5880DRAFT_666921 [Lentinula raphanica]|nr:hypothetical protein F5880DRAFT_666921 [Lentinula raphanica]
MMMFFTAAAATIGVVSVRALPVPDLDAQAMISTSELPSAIDVHNQASPQGSKYGKEITVNKRRFLNKTPVYLARSSELIKLDAHFAAHFKPMAFQVIPFVVYKDDAQWGAAAYSWSTECSSYVLNSDRELSMYKLVRKSQVPELGIDEKMDLIIASEFYKQHERLQPALAEIYHQVVKSFEPRHRVPNEPNKHLLLFIVMRQFSICGSVFYSVVSQVSKRVDEV